MNITDIIALAKNGYKPSDIKELIELATPENNSDVSDTDTATPETADTDNDNKPIDYKALYESSIKELEDVKASNKKLSDDLKQAQTLNSNKDVSDDNNTLEDAKSVWENFIKNAR